MIAMPLGSLRLGPRHHRRAAIGPGVPPPRAAPPSVAHRVRVASSTGGAPVGAETLFPPARFVAVPTPSVAATRFLPARSIRPRAAEVDGSALPNAEFPSTAFAVVPSLRVHRFQGERCCADAVFPDASPPPANSSHGSDNHDDSVPLPPFAPVTTADPEPIPLAVLASAVATRARLAESSQFPGAPCATPRFPDIAVPDAGSVPIPIVGPKPSPFVRALRHRPKMLFVRSPNLTLALSTARDENPARSAFASGNRAGGANWPHVLPERGPVLPVGVRALADVAAYRRSRRAGCYVPVARRRGFAEN